MNTRYLGFYRLGTKYVRMLFGGFSVQQFLENCSFVYCGNKLYYKV
jgi:hypothetical protein